MAVFVLVHGAWGGAHGFRKVRGPLRAAGHEVFTPSLTGIGERAHLTSARRTPHPVGCFTEPVRLARPLEDYPFTRTYIKATGEPRPESGGPFWAAADRAKTSPAWRQASAPDPAQVGAITQVKTTFWGDLIADSNTSLIPLAAV